MGTSLVAATEDLIQDTPTGLWLQHLPSAQRVRASLILKVSAKRLGEVSARWEDAKRKYNEEARGKGIPENDSWNWEQKALLSAPGDLLFGIEVEEEIQGMMMISAKPRPSRHPEVWKGYLSYIEYLESAPWNLAAYAGKSQVYAGVGTSLLRVAVAVSDLMGCEGRIGLLSLKQAEGFYESVGLQKLGFDNTENLNYFEGTITKFARRGSQ